MFEGLLQPTHLLVIFFIALLVLGPKKLPELGKGIGEGLRALKNGMKEESTASKPDRKPSQHRKMFLLEKLRRQTRAWLWYRALTLSIASFIPFLRARRPSPIPLPSSGNFFGPKTSKAIKKITSRWVGWSKPSNMRLLL